MQYMRCRTAAVDMQQLYTLSHAHTCLSTHPSIQILAHQGVKAIAHASVCVPVAATLLEQYSNV
eukprot:6243-Heterococcus_DN1.PRE.4